MLFAGAAMLRSPWKLLAGIVDIRRAIRQLQPDIVHAHWGSLLAAAAALATTGTGVPLVVTYRGSDINPVPSESKLRSLVRVSCSQVAAWSADAITCVSTELSSRLWFGRDRTMVIPDGTDLTIFRPLDRQLARRQLGWDIDEPVVFFYEGGRPEVKRRDLADDGVAQAASLLGKCRLEVMGSSVPHQMVPVLMSAADCLLMTSDYEGSPNIVREALACDIPVVSVDVGDVRRWLMGVPGTALVRREAGEIGAAIAAVIRSGSRPSIGSAAEEFSAETSNRMILQTYERVVQGRAR